MAVKIRTGALVGKGTDRWFVTDGMNAVGPVRLDLLARGVATGRVPPESFVRHDSWKVWRPLADFTEVANDAGPQLSPSVKSLMTDELSRETVELSNDDFVVESSSAPGDLEDKPSPFAQTGEVETKKSPDTVLDRPSLDSYLDDEETQIPQKKLAPYAPAEPIAGAAPRPRSVPPPPPVRAHSIPPVPTSAVPRPASIPPRPASIPPRQPSIPPVSASAPPRQGSIPPGSIPPGSMAPGASRSLPLPPPRPMSSPPARIGSVPPRPLSTPPPRAPRSPSIPPVTMSPQIFGTDDVSGAARPAESADRLPDDELTGANDLSEALLLLLGASVKRSRADAAMLHRMADDGATVLCAHGPKMVDVLGMRTRLLDPAVVAAAGGHIVVSEPAPGPAGDATISRLRKLGVDPESTAMFPLRPRGRLLAILELGKSVRLSPREIASVDALVAAFIARAEAAGWAP